MKRTIVVLFLAAMSIGSARAIELEGVILSNLPSADIGTSAIVPQAAAAKIPQTWAETAAAELRKELKSYKIDAKVTAVKVNEKDVLIVEFRSWGDYEQIKDLFYQDPGENPSYMSVKVLIKVQ